MTQQRVFSLFRREALCFLLISLCCPAEVLQTADGYNGIWYFNQPSKDEYVYKYSGGFATYPQQQSPIAIYAPKVKKTFFCYGGVPASGKQELLHMVSYFDHKTGMVPRPRILLNKKTDDAHDNPVMSIDDAGHLWIFSNSHGISRPSYIHRSVRPYDIDEFELVTTTNFSYGHPWFHPGKGFLFLFTSYENNGRSSYWSTSRDGREWSAKQELARIEMGQYQITAHGSGGRTASVFNMHPAPIGLNARTNLYYVETRDMGKTWKTVDGQVLDVPLKSKRNNALVHDYEAEGLLVYLKEVAFGRDGHPAILYLTSKGYESGPKSGPRTWRTARWTGSKWEIRDLTASDHNYDFGALWIAKDGTWQVIAPTEPGPQPHTTGGDMVLWRSRDRGAAWRKVRQLTFAKERNHTYAKKPVNAHPRFYALWADGDTKKPSGSNLFFTDEKGSAVWRLPSRMSGEYGRPELLRVDVVPEAR